MNWWTDGRPGVWKRPPESATEGLSGAGMRGLPLLPGQLAAPSTWPGGGVGAEHL